MSVCQVGLYVCMSSLTARLDSQFVCSSVCLYVKLVCMSVCLIVNESVCLCDCRIRQFRALKVKFPVPI